MRSYFFDLLTCKSYYRGTIDKKANIILLSPKSNKPWFNFDSPRPISNMNTVIKNNRHLQTPDICTCSNSSPDQAKYIHKTLKTFPQLKFH